MEQERKDTGNKIAIIVAIITTLGTIIAGTGWIKELGAKNDAESQQKTYEEEYNQLTEEFAELESLYNVLESEYKELKNNSEKTKDEGNDSEGETETTESADDSGKLALSVTPFDYIGAKFTVGDVYDMRDKVYKNPIIIRNAQLVPDDLVYNLEYDLKGEYSRLTATIAYCKENGDGYGMYLNIYVDENKEPFYTSDLINAKSDPVSIDIEFPDGNPQFVQFLAYDEENHVNNILYDTELIIDELRFYK